MGNFIVSLVALVFALIPTWIWLLVRSVAEPEGFWQNFALFGVGVWLLGGLQIFLFFFWLIFSLKMFTEQ